MPLVLPIRVLACVLISACLIAIMPSSQSFWVDEAVDAMYAMQGSFKDLLTLLSIDPKSQAQMPLGMITIWAWAKCFGISEFALRSINMVWVALSVYLFVRIGKQTGVRMLWLAVLVHPFIWYYANEARPYAMQIALGTWVVERMFHVLKHPHPKTLIGLILVSIPFAATSIIHYIPLFVIGIVLAAFAWPTWRQHPGQTIKAALFACLVHLPLACYYIATLVRGVGGQKGGTDGVGIATLGFSAYELSGFFAFGPDRNEIRSQSLEGGLSAVLEIFSPFWPLLIVVGIVSAIAFIVGFRRLMPIPAARLFWACAIVFIATALLTLIAATLKGTVLWARHLSGVFPCFLLLLAIPISQLFNSSTVTRTTSSVIFRLLAVLCIAAFLAASFRVRFSSDFAKIDNRSAAQIAIANLDQYRTVFWPGIDRAGIHYILQHPSPMKGKLITHPDPVLNGQALPDVAILGRIAAEVPRASIQSQLKHNGLSPRTIDNPRGLEIWEY